MTNEEARARYIAALVAAAKAADESTEHEDRADFLEDME